MPLPPALIAVIGPVEPALLTAWVHHYRTLGIERFLLGFHFPDHVHPQRRHHLRSACHELGIVPDAISTGPWHEHTNPRLRDALRERAGTGWHLLADSDEFHSYPAPLATMLDVAAWSGVGTVGGLMLDRVATDGALSAWDPTEGLDTAYPLGGFLTHHLLRGDPRKIVLAHSSVPVAYGNSRARPPPRRGGPRHPPRGGPPPDQPTAGRGPPLQMAPGCAAGHRAAGRALSDRSLGNRLPGPTVGGQAPAGAPPAPRWPDRHGLPAHRLPAGVPSCHTRMVGGRGYPVGHHLATAWGASQ